MFILTVLLDLVFSNYLNYNLSNISIFPMFTITYVIYELLVNKDIKNIIISTVLYSMITGILYINLLFILIITQIKTKNYLLTTLISLIIYDLLFFMLINKYSLNYLVIKIARTIPINMLYFLLLYSSKNNEKKYKLNEMITWRQKKKRKKKVR